MRHMKHILTSAILLLAIASLEAQQESQFTNFMHNYQLLNPGYVGARGIPTFTLLHRSQWIGFKGAPASQILNFNSPFFNKRVGFGIGVFHRSAGITSTWSSSMAYSYDLKLTESASVRLGLHGTVRNLAVDFSDPDVILRDSDDPSTSLGEDANRFTGNFGVGLFASIKDYYFGASVPNFFPNEIGFNNVTTVTAKEKPHFYFMAGGLFPLNDKIKLRPAVLSKYVANAPLSLDVNMTLVFEREVAVGFSYRSGGTDFGDSVDLLFFYQVSSTIGLGLSYDFSTSPLNRHNSGSFEALVKYDLRNDREDLTNPRFF